jgi:hypothetical protein
MPFSKTREIIQRGTRAAQPAAASLQEGSLYYVTDEQVTERSTGPGGTWESFADGGTGGSGSWSRLFVVMGG